MRLRRFIFSLLFASGYGAGCAHAPPAETPSDVADQVVETAIAMVGKPYRYGGSSPRGFDCSGLVHYSYRRAGVSLPRSTRALWRYLLPVSTRALRPGDLLFFDQQGKKSSHVAIYIGRNRFVHAPSTGKRVNIGSFANPYWRRHFAGARRPKIN